MEKLGYPLLLCHNLSIADDGSFWNIICVMKKLNRQAILGFQSMGYRCLAAGDSYNDIQMFEVADKGFFINAPDKNII